MFPYKAVLIKSISLFMDDVEEMKLPAGTAITVDLEEHIGEYKGVYFAADDPTEFSIIS